MLTGVAGGGLPHAAMIPQIQVDGAIFFMIKLHGTSQIMSGTKKITSA